MTEPLQFLYRITPTRLEMLTEGPTAEEQAIVSDHFYYLKELTEAGTVVVVGRTQNTDASTFGIIVFEAADEESAGPLWPAIRPSAKAS